MKIAFFSENNFEGKIPRDFPNCRTDIAWMIALSAYHYPITIDINQIKEKYDIGIVIFPKKGNDYSIEKFKSCCSIVGPMQEGPANLWEDFNMYNQVTYFNMLQDSDFILCHNQKDKLYFKGLNNNIVVETMPSLMILDSIDPNKITPPEKRSGVIIGGNMCSWYGGFPSWLVAQNFKGEKISIVSMGRKQAEENIYFPDLNYIEYKVWNEWIYELSKYKYAVHLMPTHAAGTFALNCAYLEIPCIGYSGLDSQDRCHPTTTVEKGDLAGANKIAKRLYEDKSFLDDCKWDCKMGIEYFKESNFKKLMFDKFKKLLK